MLEQLTITNFALIEKLTLFFECGFTVITGETGTGKSILIKALSLVLGGRSSKKIVRKNQKAAVIEALFILDGDAGKKINMLLEMAGIEVSDELIIRRRIASSGRNRVYLNGCLATMHMLKEIGELLVDISGQHQHLSLLRPSIHQSLLDAFGGYKSQLHTYKKCFTRWRSVTEELKNLIASEQERLARFDFISFQHNEIAQANLESGEEIKLEQEALLLGNVERLKRVANSAYYHLYESEGALLDTLSQVEREVSGVADLDERLESLCESLEESRIALEESALEFRQYGSRCHNDPRRLEEVELRLSLINGLCKKYGPTLDSILNYQESLEGELEELSNSNARIEQLYESVRKLRVQVVAKAKTLTGLRKKAAELLSEKVESELKDLSMPHARFKCIVETSDWEQDSSFKLYGSDNIYFAFSANPGTSCEPIKKIASGGELSRLMVALKTVLLELDPVPTCIFDEVDTGIGGDVAVKLGEKLGELALRTGQILCITHLPQIACYADYHFRVEKQSDLFSTTSTIRKLNKVERVDELARMLAGADITKRSRDHARELLDRKRNITPIRMDGTNG